MSSKILCCLQVDSLSSERSDLEAKVRAQEFAILQLRTELEMEKVQTRALTEEAAGLGKKVCEHQASKQTGNIVYWGHG